MFRLVLLAVFLIFTPGFNSFAAGQVLYVSPDGDGSDPISGNWSEAYPYLNEAVAAADTDGDVIVLEKSTSHKFAASADTLREIRAKISIINEDDDESYDDCVVTVQDGSGLRNLYYPGGGLTVKGITFKDAQYSATSKAQYLFGSSGKGGKNDMVFQGCRFYNITNTDGGQWGTVIRMFATTTGTQFKLKNCVIENCTTGKGYFNTVFVTNFETMILYNLVYRNNGQVGKGGSLKLSTIADENDVTAVIKNCIFEDNINVATSYSSGDGILNIGKGTNGSETMTATVQDCAFRRNTANAGAGVYCTKESMVSIRRCLFEDGYAYGDGGGVRRGGQDDNGIVGWTKIYYCKFVDNYAGRHGGAVDVYGIEEGPRHVEIYNSHFSGNSCAKLGMTVHSYAPASSVTQLNIMENCFIHGKLRPGQYHIYSENNLGFESILNTYIEGGEDAIYDSNALIE